jgi:hypothetical protein
MSSEIEMAIKIGKLIYNPEDYGSKQLAKTIALLDVHLEVKPKQGYHLSLNLRTLVEHRGDISFKRFIEEKLANIAEDTNGYDFYEMEQLAYFIRGIGYLYPPTSMMWETRDGTRKWNPAFALPGVSNHDEFYAYADKLIEEANVIREENKAKREIRKNG